MKENMDYSKVIEKVPTENKTNVRKIVTKTGSLPISTADSSPAGRQINQVSTMKDNFDYSQVIDKKAKNTTLNLNREKPPIDGSRPKALTR